MANCKGGRTYELNENLSTCTPLIKSQTYEPSFGSLPDLDISSASLDDSDYNNKSVKDRFSATSNDLEEEISTNLMYAKPVIFSSSYKYQVSTDENFDSFLPKEYDTSFENSSSKILQNNTDSTLIKETTIENINSGTDFDTGGQANIDSETKLLNKSGPSKNPIKIKLNLNSEALNEKIVNSQPILAENYEIEIRLDGKKRKRLKIHNNPLGLQGSVINSCIDLDKSRKQLMNIEEAKLACSYAKIIQDTMKYRTLFSATKIKEIELFSQTDVTNTPNESCLCNNNMDETVFKKSLLETDNGDCVVMLKPNNSLTNCRHSEVGSDKSTIEKKSAIDKDLPTTTKSRTRLALINDGKNMMKLRMWLELLNSSEYNNYNEESCLNNNLKISNNIKKARINQNQRDFQSFIRELECSELNCLPFNLPHTNFQAIPTISEKPSIVHSDASRSISLPFESNGKFEDIRNLGRFNRNLYDKYSTESVNLGIDNLSQADIDKKTTEKASSRKNDGSNFTYDSSMKKKCKHFFENLISNSQQKKNDIDERSNYTVSGKSTGNSRWNKINPFRFCFFREKSAKQSDSKSHKSYKEEWTKKTTEIHYCCTHPSSIYQTVINSKESIDDNKQNEINKDLNNKNNNYYTEVSYYTQNPFPSDFSPHQYPYDTLPLMRCAAGCFICDPDVSKLPYFVNMQN